MMNKRLTNEELAQIKERAEKATSAPWKIGASANEVVSVRRPRRKPIITRPDADGINDAAFIVNAREDIPKLMAEIESLQSELAGDGLLTLTEQVDHAREEIRRLDGLVGHYKGYADRFSDDIPEYKAEIERLNAKIGELQEDNEVYADIIDDQYEQLADILDIINGGDDE